LRLGWVIVAGLIISARSACAGWEFGGHAKGQLSWQVFDPHEVGALLAGDDVRLATGDFRLNALWHQGSWDFIGQGQIFVLLGDLASARGDPPLPEFASFLSPLPEPSDSRELLDLSHTLSRSDSHLVLGRVDRLSVGYTRGPLALRLGRQALSWGNGLVFQVFDFFNPFAPDALDKEYKPGDDMLTAQWLFSNGDDLQGVVVPRRADRSLPLTGAESSAALKWRHLQGSYQIELLGAEHYQDTIVGLALSGNAGGGVWRVDIIQTFTQNGSAVMSLVSNYDRSWVLGKKNVYGFVEYFRNGFGATGFAQGLEGLDPRLVERLSRGEIFSLGRDEFAGGFRIEWTPLTIFEFTALIDPIGPSAYLLPQLHHELQQNLDVDAGVQLNIGGRGTEYGGVYSSALDAYLTPGRMVWVRLARYF
jgi:hypothetical protein